MFKKIDIYVNKEYACSTNQSRTCREAKEKFLQTKTATKAGIKENQVKCFFDKNAA